MAKLTEAQLEHFEAESGACSEVTVREASRDKSITIDRFEKSEIFRSYGPRTFKRGGRVDPNGRMRQVKKSAASAKINDKKKFNIYDFNPLKLERTAELAIKYPKRTGNELRLYFQKRIFSPPKNAMFFIFHRKGDEIPNIGFAEMSEWTNIFDEGDRGASFEFGFGFDEEDTDYQKGIHSPQAKSGKQHVVGVRYKRNAALAAEVARSANFTCELDPRHKTFRSATHGEQFIEAHHLVPVACEERFDYPLDVRENIVILCPNCHRAIHLADSATKSKMLKKFFKERRKPLKRVGITLNQKTLLEIYKAS